MHTIRRTVSISKTWSRSGMAPDPIVLRRGEHGETTLEISVLGDDNEPYALDGKTVKICAKYEGGQWEREACSVSGNVASYVVSSTFTSVKGRAAVSYLDVITDETALPSDTLPIYILDNVDGTGDELVEYQNVVDRLTEELESYRKTLEAEEVKRASAESSRVEAEAARDAAEKTRQAQESTRQSQEAKRQSQEADREAAEKLRESAEEKRKSDSAAAVKSAADAASAATKAKETLEAAAKAGEFDGATFTPSVNEDCDLSWTNDKGRPNPPTVNIKGDQGDQGPQGPQGDEGPQGDPGIDAKITSATATVKAGHLDAPTCAVAVGGAAGAQTLTFTFDGLQGAQGVQGDEGAKGDAGTPAKITAVKATVDATHSDSPTCEASASGDAGAQTLTFAFKGLQGAQGPKGDKGDDGGFGTETVGSATEPIYLNEGAPTAIPKVGKAQVADKLAGLENNPSSSTWGVTTGDIANTGAGAHDSAYQWRSDCPSTGKLSLKVDGEFYAAEGAKRVYHEGDVIPVADGGTGAKDAAGARSNLGLGSAATLNSPIPVANGGTGATSLLVNQVLLGNGTTAITSTAASGVGVLKRSAVSAAPAFGTVATADIADSAITTAKIANGTIDAADLNAALLKRITDLEAKAPKLLYYDEETPMGGVITLSDSAANYDLLIIGFKDTDGYRSSAAVYKPDGKTVSAVTTNYDPEDIWMHFKAKTLDISGTSINTHQKTPGNYMAGEFSIREDSYPRKTGQTDMINVYVVIGFKL